jgi:hypothetical protein
MKKLFALVALVLTLGCASMSIRQQAAVTLDTALFSVETARFLERNVCDSTVANSAVLTNCTLEAHQLGLSDEKHQALARLFAAYFKQVAASSDAFTQWTPIEARPTLDQLVSTVHLIKVELAPLAGNKKIAAVIAALDQSLVLVQKVQGLK